MSQNGFSLAFCHLIAVRVGHFELGFGVRCYLDEPEVATAVQMLEDGATQRTVAERLEVGRSVVARLSVRLQETGEYRRRPGQQRTRIVIFGTWHVVIVGLV